MAVSGYKLGPMVVRALADLTIYPTFGATSVIDVSRARSGMLLVTYTQGATVGDQAFPVMRMRGGHTSGSLFVVPIEDARAPVNLGAGIGLETDARNTVKKFTDAFVTPQAYPIDLSRWRYAQFEFAEDGGDPGDPGQLLVQLIIELDH